MDASSVYPNWPPVLTTLGLGGALASADPDRIALDPDATNDQRKRYSQRGGAVDASGVLRLHVRNSAGYAYLRPHHDNKFLVHSATYGHVVWSRMDAQAAYYRSHYRHHVPNDLLVDHLYYETKSKEEGKWQGNAIAGVDCGQAGHVVLHPTGQILQQACAWYGGEDENDTGHKSSTIETGNVIHQFTVMGSGSRGAAPIYAAARGVTNCTIVATPSRSTRERPAKMQAKAKLSFPEALIHVAGSPHVEAELAFVTTDGVVRSWEPEGGVRSVNKIPRLASERLSRCEYSSHPCVLWTASRFTVSTLDLRQPPQQENTLFDLSSVGAIALIYDLKRRSSNPFQFVIGSGVSVELVDTRMAKKSLISWPQPASYSSSQQDMRGAIDEVDISRNANDNRGYIVSSSQRHKVTTLFSFERNRKRQRSSMLSLSSLRSSAEDEYAEVKRSSIDQIVASDAPLDLHLEDGGEWTSLLGICALRDRGEDSASIYQLNSVGDLFSHRVAYSRAPTKSYHAAVQPNLPCGVTGQDDPSDPSLARTLPLPVDAILPEHDMDSMVPFKAAPLKAVRRKFPRLRDDDDVSVKGEIEDTEEKSEDNDAIDTPRFDRDALTQNLLRVCAPSASLYRLHRYVVDELKIRLSSSSLLQLLRSHRDFQIRYTRMPLATDTWRVLTPVSVRGGHDNIHVQKDDPRLAICTCSESGSTVPCESMSCVVPHTIVVSRTATEVTIDEMCPSTSDLVMPEEFAAALDEAREAYDELT